MRDNITEQTSQWASYFYKELVDDESKGEEEKKNLKLTQNVALQLYFDVQFIMQCLTSRENKEASTTCQTALTAIERHADPFDLSVFSPYITTNVKRCVLKFQAMFGILIPSDRYALLTSMKATLPQLPTSGASASTGAVQASENSIQLSNCTHRFTLLPVSSRVETRATRTGSRAANRNLGARAKADQASSVKTEEPTADILGSRTASSQGQSPSTRKREKSPVNKAWSAFEEMSKSWFGSGK